MRTAPWSRPMFLLCFSCLACVAPNTAQQPRQARAAQEVYTIGAEDVLEIAVWQNADLSRTVTVRPDGKISLPLINDVDAAGLTPEGLKTEIARKLGNYMTTSPQLSVIVVQANSRKFFIQGEVRNPGTYPLRSRTTVSQAISLAGGLTEFAKKNKIRVIRTSGATPEVIEVKYRKIMQADSAQDDIPLMPGDTLVVP